MSEKPERPIIIVKKRKGGDGGHHGGAWKVAYADFVTAMMAFFLVMWLVAAVTKEQRAAMFEYFKNPSMGEGKSVKAAKGANGPGGMSTSVINLHGGMDAPKSAIRKETGLQAGASPAPSTVEEARRIAAEADHKKLESLMEELRKAIDASQALKPFKDQLLLDLTPDGLRIQIVDKQNRPMFDLGGSKLKGYTAEILHELAPYLNSVPNRISFSGHTDTTPYPGGHGYTNWDLSADRANAARRALESGGLQTEKVARVVGLSSSVLFDKENQRNPINRRISIIVMTKEAEERAFQSDRPEAGEAPVPEGAAGEATAEGAPAAASAPAPTPASTPASTPGGAGGDGKGAPVSPPVAPAAGSPPAAPKANGSGP
ncbi:MAG: motB2 [Pseudomonadota bacterium]